MEATKALAQRLRHRASLRRTNKKQNQQQVAAQPAQPAETPTAKAQTPSRAAGQSEKRRDSNIPAVVAIPAPDPPATTPTDHAPDSTTDQTVLTVHGAAPEAPLTPESESNVSPNTQVPPNPAPEAESVPASTPASDYFTLAKDGDPAPVEDAPPPNKITFALPNHKPDTRSDADPQNREDSPQDYDTAVSSATPSTTVSPRPSVEDAPSEGRRSSLLSYISGGRKRSSIISRNRDSSPSISLTTTPSRFRKHVTFSNVHLGEPTKWNFPCYTLIVRHLGYQSRRRSRTFMVGIDDHEYSDEALQWLFNEFVDDGDEIVCVRVVEKDVRVYEADKRLEDFQREANAEVEKIKARCGESKAISIVLEYAVGKLHSTFQRLIQLHSPSMLIVGTRGRTLGGFQGLVASRNSFSKYCLQYSPVPVVVVRPDEKRQKKKGKRDNDPEKRGYRQMLQSNQGIHEADNDSVSAWEIESKLSAVEEAGKVARALGLPAKFDPTLKPYKPERQKSSLSMTLSLGEAEPGRLVADTRVTPTASAVNSAVNSAANSAANSEDEAEASGEDDDEFEVTSGAKLVQSQKRELRAQLEAEKEEQQKKNRLHAMEMGEGNVLKNKPAELESDFEEDDDDEDDEDGGGAVKTSSSE